jgi:hypothetical protein
VRNVGVKVRLPNLGLYTSRIALCTGILVPGTITGSRLHKSIRTMDREETGGGRTESQVLGLGTTIVHGTTKADP